MPSFIFSICSVVTDSDFNFLAEEMKRKKKPLTKEQLELMENFRLDYLDAEYEMCNHLDRELTERESSYLFLNFLRRNMGLGFMCRAKQPRGIFGNPHSIKRVDTNGYFTCEYERFLNK